MIHILLTYYLKNVFAIDNIQYSRFARTIPTKKSVNKRYDDYYNVIYDFKKNDDSLDILVDFQHVFAPRIKSIDDFKIDLFYEENLLTINNSIVEWLKDEQK